MTVGPFTVTRRDPMIMLMLTRLLTVIVMVVCIVGTPVWAQGGALVPQPRFGGWPAYLIAALLAGLVIAVNVKKSGRGHQD